jgi:hypothetical protein
LGLNYSNKVNKVSHSIISNEQQLNNERQYFKLNKILDSIREKNASEVLKLSTKRFLAYDGGGFDQSNSQLIKCANNIEVEITTSYENADFSFFHMSLIQLDKLSVKANKKVYTMVYTLESEVKSFEILQFIVKLLTDYS